MTCIGSKRSVTSALNGTLDQVIVREEGLLSS